MGRRVLEIENTHRRHERGPQKLQFQIRLNYMTEYSGKTVRGHAILVNFHTNLSLFQFCVYNPVPIKHRGTPFGLVLYEAMGL